MAPRNRKILMFLMFVIGVGIIYPLIMSGIFRLQLKTSMIIGMIMGITGGIIWVVTANQKEKRNTAKNAEAGGPSL